MPDDPVLAGDEGTYEKKFLLEWFKYSDRLPLNRNKKKDDYELLPNNFVKERIQELKNEKEKLKKELKELKELEELKRKLKIRDI